MPVLSPSPPLPSVFVAVGSNLDDPVSQVLQGIRALRNLAASGFRASSLWSSAPVDCPPDSPRFVNAVVGFDPCPGETPETLLASLQLLERRAGRPPIRLPNEPRPLDLDLIGFGRESRATPALILPHPRAHLRRFVLVPLAEIAPGLRLPGWPADARELATAPDEARGEELHWICRPEPGP